MAIGNDLEMSVACPAFPHRVGVGTDDVQEWPVVASDKICSAAIQLLIIEPYVVAIDFCNCQATYFYVLSLCWFKTVTPLILCINYYEKIMILFDKYDD